MTTDDDVIMFVPQHAEVLKLPLGPTVLKVITFVKHISSCKTPGKDVVQFETYKDGGQKLFKKYLEDIQCSIGFNDASVEHLYKHKGN